MTGLIGGIEAGGTKFLLGVQRGFELIAQHRVPTTDPDETIGQVADFFKQTRLQHGPLSALGLATFGPVELDRADPLFGHIFDTPKPGWDRFDIFSAVASATAVPVAIDTDVNAAALAEGRNGVCKGLARYCYVTVGTGIGVGFVEDGRLSRARPHAEAGHMRVGRPPGDSYLGHCPYHGDCVEGLASGPSMKVRWGMTGSQLQPGHEAWDFESHYIAGLCANLTYAFRPQRIVLSGGVFNAPFLLDRVRRDLGKLLNGYAPGPYATDPQYLAAPEIDDPSPGLVGAFLLAKDMMASAV